MSTRSFDSGQRPLNNHYRYESTSMHDDYYDQQVYRPPVQKKNATKKWLKIGLPIVVVLAIIAAVIAGVVATRHHNNNQSASTSGKSSGSSKNGNGGSNGGQNLGVFFTTTNAYGLPVYPTTTDSALFASPTFNPSATAAWPADSTSFANPTPTAVDPSAVRSHPRLIAPGYKWEALPELIAKDPYLSSWNDTIFGNATIHLGQDPLAYTEDGGLTGSGVLDVARSLKLRVKNLAYAYRISNETKYADKVWRELQNAAANTTNPFGTSPTNWNPQHFLDLGEFTAAFSFGYDWLYDYWTDQQRDAIMWSIITLGLNQGISAYTDPSDYNGWWRSAGNNNGNWNCVCNSGLTLGALAIIDRDPTGKAAQMLSLTIPNARTGCFFGPEADGTWSETSDYWYFGTTAAGEMSSSLLTATGSDFGLLSANPSFNMTGLFHMHVMGMTSKFQYGDHGPNKFSTTANSMMFFGKQYNIPEYMLFQRDQLDAAEPFGVLWYDPSVQGAFWYNQPLDHYFGANPDQWAAMRTSWTDDKGLYFAMKAGNMTGHQAHGDLDAGDFVIDAMGDRFAGELGSANYLGDNYFSNETQSSERWYYYRKRTEGQNTILLGQANQAADAQPTTKFDTTAEAQPGGTTQYSVPSTSTAFFTADLTESYFGTSIKRGGRLINGRKQILIQDDISNANTTSQWRMHTNATVSVSGTTATLTMPGTGNKMTVTILNAPSGVQFSTAQPVRFNPPTDPPLPSDAASQDMPNTGTTVLTIDIPAGTNSIQVLFNPQWSGMSAGDFKTPPNVPVDQWSLTSHN